MKKPMPGKAESAFFLALLAAVCLISDRCLWAYNPIGRSAYFRRNDFEKTVSAYNTTNFGKLFFGNSALISGFRAEKSASGYAEMGLVYGKIDDLKGALENRFITVKSELALALNYFVFMDVLSTDPTYLWHKRKREAYLAFNGERVKAVLTDAIESCLRGEEIPLYPEREKYIARGALSDAELNERLIVHEKNYWSLGLDAFNANFKALDWVIDYCAANGIRLRAVWMPQNPYRGLPEIAVRVMSEANARFSAQGVETLDLTNAFGRECFYDMGHLNNERGADMFTEAIDLWLKK